MYDEEDLLPSSRGQQQAFLPASSSFFRSSTQSQLLNLCARLEVRSYQTHIKISPTLERVVGELPLLWAPLATQKAVPHHSFLIQAWINVEGNFVASFEVDPETDSGKKSGVDKNIRATWGDQRFPQRSIIGVPHRPPSLVSPRFYYSKVLFGPFTWVFPLAIIYYGIYILHLQDHTVPSRQWTIV